MKRGFPMRWLLAAALSLGACQLVSTECGKECQDEKWLDSGLLPDECLDTTVAKCLVSQSIPAPTAAQKESLQVIIAVHGFAVRME
jgi:hypothetical protein